MGREMMSENYDVPISRVHAVEAEKAEVKKKLSQCYERGAKEIRRLEAEVEQLRENLNRAQQDINWMLNNRKFLNPDVFDYLDDPLPQRTEQEVSGV